MCAGVEDHGLCELLLGCVCVVKCLLYYRHWLGGLGLRLPLSLSLSLVQTNLPLPLYPPLKHALSSAQAPAASCSSPAAGT